MAKTSPHTRPPTSEDPKGTSSPNPRVATGTEAGSGTADDLSFREAQTALELCLAQLQDQELDVESMADLYLRAQCYADRCEAVLQQVEQQIMQWDPVEPDPSPRPYMP